MSPATFHLGQIVPFPPATDGWAQVADLARTNVVIAYKRKGRTCRRRINAIRLAEQLARIPLLIETHNLLGRAILPREKTFTPGARHGFARKRIPPPQSANHPKNEGKTERIHQQQEAP